MINQANMQRDIQVIICIKISLPLQKSPLVPSSWSSHNNNGMVEIKLYLKKYCKSDQTMVESLKGCNGQGNDQLFLCNGDGMVVAEIFMVLEVCCCDFFVLTIATCTFSTAAKCDTSNQQSKNKQDLGLEKFSLVGRGWGTILRHLFRIITVKS